jgi:formylglycine-generating enzyme
MSHKLFFRCFISSMSLITMKKTLVMSIVFVSMLVAGCMINSTNQSYRDCENCPLVIDINGGRFLMGTAIVDRLIDPRTGKPATNDGPQHEVTIANFSMAIHEVTIEDFARFIAATKYETSAKCMEFSKPAGFSINSDTRWDTPGLSQSRNAPVSCVSFYDAQAYADWLSNISGQNYRLPTEAEWEYAARAGAIGPYFWGNDRQRACEFANVRSEGAYTISKRQLESDKSGFPCDDGFPQSSPVGSFKPNNFGLYDMQGNNWEWVADCSHKSYAGAPLDGSAWQENQCQFGVIRGGSYLNLVERSSVTVRAGRPRSGAATNMGFRVAKGSAIEMVAVTSIWNDRPDTANSPAEQLFNNNCAACHQDRTKFKGLYGKDEASLFEAIKEGGNNVMSMPAFGSRLTDAEISLIAKYLVEQNDWAIKSANSP